MKPRYRFCALLAFAASMLACSGGGGGGEDTTPPPVGTPPPSAPPPTTPGYNSRLIPAQNYNEFVTQARSRYPNSRFFGSTSSDTTMWKSARDLPRAYAQLSTNNHPISGRYTTWSVRDYPRANGDVLFGPTGADRGRMTFQTIDLTNQQTSVGDAQAFYGFQEADSFAIGCYGGAAQNVSSNSRIPTSLVMEELIKNPAGEVQYRSIRFMLGYLTNYTPALSLGPGCTGTPVVGPTHDGVMGHTFAGLHVQEVVECFVSNCQVGAFVEYALYMAKTPGSP